MGDNIVSLVDRVITERAKGARFPTTLRISTITRLSIKVGQDLSNMPLGYSDEKLARRIRDAARELGVEIA